MITATATATATAAGHGAQGFSLPQGLPRYALALLLALGAESVLYFAPSGAGFAALGMVLAARSDRSRGIFYLCQGPGGSQAAAAQHQCP